MIQSETVKAILIDLSGGQKCCVTRAYVCAG